jgi:hypothetical protein
LDLGVVGQGVTIEKVTACAVLGGTPFSNPGLRAKAFFAELNVANFALNSLWFRLLLTNQAKHF